MTRREKAYIIASLVFGVLTFMVVAQILFLWPQKDSAFNNFMASIFGILGTVLVACSISNLACGRLASVVTTVQIIFLFPMLPLGTALAVWGLLLLRRRNRLTTANEAVERTAARTAVDGP